MFWKTMNMVEGIEHILAQTMFYILQAYMVCYGEDALQVLNTDTWAWKTEQLPTTTGATTAVTIGKVVVDIIT
jgi:hypothetical protein